MAAVVIDTSDLVDATDEAGGPEDLSRRVWELQLAERRRNLARGGVPEVFWHAGADVGQSIARLRHVSRAVRR